MLSFFGHVPRYINSEACITLHNFSDLTGEDINTELYHKYTANELRRTLQSLSRKPRRPVLGVLPDVPNRRRSSDLGSAGVSPQKPEPQADESCSLLRK